MKGICALIAGIVLLGVAPRAYAAPTVFLVTLDGPSESPPNASLGTGSATITYDAVAHTLRVQVTFSGLSGTTTASHIHGATAVAGTGTAGVATQTPSFVGFPSGVTSGSFDGTLDLTLAASWNAAFITANGGTPTAAEAVLSAAMATGKAYLNIHTTVSPGGEIRGFLQQATPAITGQPVDIAICAGSTAGFFATASGTPVPTVQWQLSTDGGANFENIPGPTSTTLTVSGVTAAMSGHQYRAVFTNPFGSATTSAATLTVYTASALAGNPADQTVLNGGTAVFAAVATGQPAPSVQWQVSVGGGAFADISGATSPTLILGSVTPAMNGNQYRAVFTNLCAVATTVAATLTVLPAFTDPALTVDSSPIRAAHVIELRAHIDAVRLRYGLSAYASYSQVVNTAALISAADVLEMRQALLEAYNAANSQGKGLSLPVYSTSPAPGAAVRAADVTELRNAVVLIETH